MVLRSRTTRTLIPYWILAGALALTMVAGWYTARTRRQHDLIRFEYVADRVKSAIESRLDAYMSMLSGGAGLFAASADVEYPEFHAYVERLQISRRYPGIQGIGFSRVVRPGERGVVADGIELARVADAAACGSAPAYYFNQDFTKIFLCQNTCVTVQADDMAEVSDAAARRTDFSAIRFQTSP